MGATPSKEEGQLKTMVSEILTHRGRKLDEPVKFTVRTSEDGHLTYTESR